MLSSYAHLCQRCTSLLRTKITWQYFPHVQLCSAAIKASAKIPNESTSRHTRQKWKQQMRYYSDLTAKHLTSEAKDKEDLLRTDVVAYKSPVSQFNDAVPVTESQITSDLDAAAELSPLEDICDEEAVSISVPPALTPVSISLSDYVDKSETLTKLVQLGVSLWKLEKRPNVGSMLLKLDYQTDVVPTLLFLKDIGVRDTRLGYILSHNPFILTDSVETLQARVDNLLSKKFTLEAVALMVCNAPYLLSFSVERMDNRLAFFHQQLGLSDSNTRHIITRLPKLLCGSLEPVKENLMVYQIEFGFKENEIQHMILTVPKMLIVNKNKLTKIFDFLHNTMKVPHHMITKFPKVLNSKYLRLKERHLFLEYLGKAQYDPEEPNYVSLHSLVVLPDDAFCNEVALATLDDLYSFQKTL